MRVEAEGVGVGRMIVWNVQYEGRGCCDAARTHMIHRQELTRCRNNRSILQYDDYCSKKACEEGKGNNHTDSDTHYTVHTVRTVRTVLCTYSMYCTVHYVRYMRRGQKPPPPPLTPGAAVMRPAQTLMHHTDPDTHSVHGARTPPPTHTHSRQGLQ